MDSLKDQYLDVLMRHRPGELTRGGVLTILGLTNRPHRARVFDEMERDGQIHLKSKGKIRYLYLGPAPDA